jgi:hypothetical protein
MLSLRTRTNSLQLRKPDSRRWLRSCVELQHEHVHDECVFAHRARRFFGFLLVVTSFWNCDW